MKSPARVAAGRLNGIKSGEARRAKPKPPRVRMTVRRKAAGLCIDCGLVPPLTGRVRCFDCACEHSDRARAYYHRHAARLRAEQLARYYARKAAA